MIQMDHSWCVVIVFFFARDTLHFDENNSLTFAPCLECAAAAVVGSIPTREGDSKLSRDGVLIGKKFLLILCVCVRASWHYTLNAKCNAMKLILK